MNKIGFDTNGQNEEDAESRTGYAECLDDDSRGDFWMNVAMQFLIVYGALAICKDVVLFLKSMKEKG